MKKMAVFTSVILTLALLLGACATDNSGSTDSSGSPENAGSSDNAGSTDSSDSSDSSADTGTSNLADTVSDPVELRFSWWGSENRHEAFLEVIDLYTSQNPGVTIKAEYGAWDGWQQNILTQLGGKTEADIMQVNYNWVHSFGKGSNVFANLRDLSDYIDLSNWEDEYLSAMTVGGELGAIPHGMNGRAHLYVKPMFEDAGIEYPLTYDDLMAAGAIIGADNTPTGSENKYVFMNIGRECPDLFIAQMLYNETGKVMQVDGVVQYTEEEVAKVFEQYLAFADSGAMETFNQLDALDNESNPVWASGRGGSIYEWVGTMDKYLGSYKGGGYEDEIGVAPFIVPSASTTPNIYVKPNLGYAISNNSKNKEVAADFLNFFFTDEEAVKILGTSIGISSNDVTRDIQERAGMLEGIMKTGYDMLDNYQQTVMDPYFEDSNVRGARYLAIEAFRSGKDSPEKAAADYISLQQAELDKLFN